MTFWHFASGHDMGPALHGSYDLGLVALSVLVAIVGALAALSVVTRLRFLTSARSRRLWLAAGSVAMGSGIWAMHFTGMLAFNLSTEITFALLPTLVSIVPAVIGSAVALIAIDARSSMRQSMSLSALAFAVAIATMHFVGMEAMRVEDATMSYDPALFALSVALAYGLALAALHVRSVVERSTAPVARFVPRAWTTPIAATVMGCAVAGMHYTAMATATFAADPSAMPHEDNSLSRTAMALSVVVVCLAIAALTTLGVAVDRKLKEASQKFDADRKQHRAVTDSMRDGLIVVTDERIQSLNPAAERIFGYHAGELVGLRIDRILPQMNEGVEAYLSSHSEADGLHKDGSPVSLAVMSHSIRVGRAVATTVIVRARDEVEALERSLRRLAAAVEFTEEAIAIIDADLRVAYVNPAFARQFRGHERRTLGSSASSALGIDADSDAYRNIKDALARTRVWQGELSAVFRDGRPRQLDVSISPVRNDINLVTNFVVFVRDMTDKRAFDDERHEAQRLESMGHLAAGVAEDIDAPAQQLAASLRTLADNLTVLLDGRPIAPGERQPAAAIERALAEAEEGVARIASVVRAVQEFSRPGSEAIELADVNAALRSAAIVCRASWKNIADLEFDLAADLPPVPCHVADLNQVFLSLIVNAADAVAGGATMGAKGRIVVTTRAVGEQVEITVRDNGPGIPETVAARVFEPAFTTKGAGNRTGQGLAACRAAIVDKHGGTLTFDSLPGVATTFRIRLPLARQAVRRAS